MSFTLRILGQRSLYTCARMASDTPQVSNKSSEVQEKPLYATKANYKKMVVAQRFQNASEEYGEHPTKWQKRFLVLTKMYQRQSDIPEIVASGTMNRMHDRMRVVFIFVGIFSFFLIFYLFESINFYKMSRDRDAGVEVKEMKSFFK